MTLIDMYVPHNYRVEKHCCFQIYTPQYAIPYRGRCDANWNDSVLSILHIGGRLTL